MPPEGNNHTAVCSVANSAMVRIALTKLASNAYSAPYTKTPHFHGSGNEGFLLVEALPNPRRTQFCVLKTLDNFQRLCDFANR